MKREMQMQRAIKRKCLDCMGGQKKEVPRCPLTDCPLYPFRIGSPAATQSEK